MKHLLSLFITGILFLIGIFALYHPLGRNEIPQAAPFFLGEGSIWNMIASTAKPEVVELSLTTISDSIQITRDENEIPIIKAKNYNDALTALGYITAKDRYFQMALYARMASGQLSEWFGDEFLSVDEYMLKLGIDAMAWEKVNSMSKEEYALLNAYSDGVNIFLNSVLSSNPPVEFQLLGISNRYFRPVDGIRILYLYEYFSTFSYNDLLKEELIRSKGLEAFQTLFYDKVSTIRPDGRRTSFKTEQFSHHPKTVYPDAITSFFKESEMKVSSLLGMKSSMLSSTSFIHTKQKGEKTNTHAGIDFSGPLHLPNVLYEAIMNIDEGENKRILTMAGLPGILASSSPALSWYLQPASIDLVDFFEVDTLAYSFKSSSYIIKSKSGNERELTVNRTESGILLEEGSEPILMLWQTFSRNSTLITMKEMLTAESINELHLLSNNHTIPFSFITAFDEENIAFWTSGEPIVSGDFNFFKSKEVSHQEYISWKPSQLMMNPSSNFISYSNSYPYLTHKAVPYFPLGSHFRRERMSELGSKVVSDENFTVYQLMDDVKMSGDILVPMIAKSIEGQLNNPLSQVVKNLKIWDFKATENAYYPMFVLNLKRILEQNLFQNYNESLIPDEQVWMAELSVNPDQKPFEELRYTNSTAQEIVSNSTQEAYELTILENGTIENWNWGNQSNVKVIHVSNNLLLNSLKEVTISGKGANSSIHFRKKSMINTAQIARFRVHYSDGFSFRSILLGGNSGNVFKSSYTNQLKLWQEDRFKGVDGIENSTSESSITFYE